MLCLLWSNGDHSRSAFRRLNSVLKLLVRRINSSRDIAIYRFWRFGLKLPIHAILKIDMMSCFGSGCSDLNEIRQPDAEQHADYGEMLEMETGSRTPI